MLLGLIDALGLINLSLSSLEAALLVVDINRLFWANEFGFTNDFLFSLVRLIELVSFYQRVLLSIRKFQL